jgi:diguanylate cyclase (GGDEF)-like protein/PAS domain S-box-containing protein
VQSINTTLVHCSSEAAAWICRAPMWPAEVLRQMLEQAQTGILVIQDGCVGYANLKVAEWTGYPIEDLSSGRVGLLDMVAPEFRALVADGVKQRVAGVPGKPYDIQCLRRDGSRFDGRVCGRLIEIDGRPANLVALHDITEIKAGSRDLLAHEQLLAEAEQLASSGSVCMHLREAGMELSAGMCRLLGEPIQPGPVSWAWFLDHVPESDRDTVSAVYLDPSEGPPREVMHRLLQSDGAMRTVLQRVFVETGPDGLPLRLRAVVRDITDLQQVTQCNYRLEHADLVTGLANRRSFYSLMSDTIRRGQHRPDFALAAMVLRIDPFVPVNETHGSGAGGALLKDVAGRISECTERADQLAYLGAGVYAVQLSGPAATEQALQAMGHALMQMFSTPFRVGPCEQSVSAAIGVAQYPVDGHDPDDLVPRAQAALRASHPGAPSNVSFYEPHANERSEQCLRSASRLRRAIENQELVLHYQPQVSLSTGKIVGVEALVRWQDPEHGLILPTEFIPLAEATGSILLIDDWVLRTACRQALAWSAAGLMLPRVSLNLSASRLLQPDVVKHVQAVLLEIGVDPRLIGIEVAENVLMHHVQHVTRALTELKALGLKISLDDFGTGYSSLSHLHNLPIDVVKIDRSFVQDVTHSTRSVSMTRAIINMAHSLQIEVLAEGVETDGQLALLVGSHCEFMQGFYFSDAVPAPAIDTLLQQGRCLPPALLRVEVAQRTLLLVDDEENIVSALRRALRSDGYHVVTANSGMEGLQRLSEHQVSVIVSDQRMPGMTGVDFLRRAKELYPDTVRIVLSGYTELKSVTDAINEGAIYKFLTKPWDDDQLRGHIAEAFRRKELADENHRLARELKEANHDLDEVNRRLQSLLDIQGEQISRDRARLEAVYELLECIPLPMVGIDVEGIVAFVNSTAEQVIVPGSHIIGLPAAEVLPADLLAAAETDLPRTVLIGGKACQAFCRNMTNGDGPCGKLLVVLP